MIPVMRGKQNNGIIWIFLKFLEISVSVEFLPQGFYVSCDPNVSFTLCLFKKFDYSDTCFL